MPPAPLAARLRAVRSSPVRDILALTAREDVVSFAGGLPANELSDAAGLRAAFAAVLADGVASRTTPTASARPPPGRRSSRRTLRLSFTSHAPDRLAQGLARLAAALGRA